MKCWRFTVVAAVAPWKRSLERNGSENVLGSTVWRSRQSLVPSGRPKRLLQLLLRCGTRTTLPVQTSWVRKASWRSWTSHMARGSAGVGAWFTLHLAESLGLSALTTGRAVPAVWHVLRGIRVGFLELTLHLQVGGRQLRLLLLLLLLPVLLSSARQRKKFWRTFKHLSRLRSTRDASELAVLVRRNWSALPSMRVGTVFVKVAADATSPSGTSASSVVFLRDSMLVPFVPEGTRLADLSRLLLHRQGVTGEVLFHRLGEVNKEVRENRGNLGLFRFLVLGAERTATLGRRVARSVSGCQEKSGRLKKVRRKVTSPFGRLHRPEVTRGSDRRLVEVLRAVLLGPELCFCRLLRKCLRVIHCM